MNRATGRASAGLPQSIDQDGVVQIALRPEGREPWIWFLGLAAIGALVALGLGMRSLLVTPPASGGRPPGSDERAPGVALHGRPGGTRRTTARRTATAEPAAPSDPDDPPPPESDEPAEPLDTDTADEAHGAEPAGEERTGIALFPARGTKPIKLGIVVPDDFPLPPGYMRHFQATDKGRMLPAILMFHPDYQPLGADGQPIPLPQDRVVPLEMAPPGLPIQMLQVSKEEQEIEQTAPAPDQDGAESDP